MLVVLLIIYHLYCYKFTRQFARDGNVRTARWYRMFNELPSLLLVGIVILAVVKP
jgi:putative membrane protein